MRAISTVLDVAVFLLLVSAAVGTLVYADAPSQTATDADETAEVIASSTLSIEYDLGGETRRAHGTVGVLLARAAVANVSFGGTTSSLGHGDFAATVRAKTRSRLVAPNRTRIVARWTPYRGGLLQGRVNVGPSPPDGVDVHSATVTVPAPIPDSRRRAIGHSGEGHDGVAHHVAAATVDGLLPDNRIDAAAFRQSTAATVTTNRYEAITEVTGTDRSGLLASGSVRAAHRRVTADLARTFATDMRERFDGPVAAAKATRTGVVRITVRRWEP